MSSMPSRRETSATDVWHGATLREAFALATRWLTHHRDRVNALNVFPVPDGDTGTNMSMTMQASLDAARTVPEDATAGDVAGRIAYGALMGARGNSGVILSQVFRGFANAIGERVAIDGQDMAHALDGARAMAYKAVMRPVEGTMLTVIRVAAERALETAARTPALRTVLEAALAGAREALERTPEQLDILRQANVVDAGGQGIVYILEGLHRYACGITEIGPLEEAETPTLGAGMAFLDDVAALHGENPFGYCTNFMVFGEGIDVEQARDRLAGMGESAVVVGDESVLKVHLHTEHPGRVLEYALTLGYLDQIKIDNMTLQTEALTDQRKQGRAALLPADGWTEPLIDEQVDGAIGIVTVAAGAGLVQALRSMGANAIVPGGQTMNPSTEDLLKAVERLPVDQVIILPNNKNIIMAANQVQGLTKKRVAVVPSRSVPQGLAALSAFNHGASLDENIAAMTSTLEHVHAIEVTQAVRDVELHGVHVVSGQFIGLVDGDLVASGSDIRDVVSRALARLRDSEPELLTIFSGIDATPEETAAREATAATSFPDAEIEVVAGGQPHYHFVISVE